MIKRICDVLKYCIYYLQQKKKDLTVRDLLKFQNGGIVEGLDISRGKEGAVEGTGLDNYGGYDKSKLL